MFFCLRSIFFFLLLLNPISASTTPKYIWNLGLAINCDISPFHGVLPENYHTWDFSQYLEPKSYIKNIQDGDIIWLQARQVAEFYHNVLPNINKHFILYICDGDESFPSSHRKTCKVDTLINDPRVIHIFGQNVDYMGFRKKVSKTPIGIDFHTVAHPTNCKLFQETKKSIQQQEQELDELLATLKPTDQRIKKAFVDFQLADRGNIFGESRSEIFKLIYKTGLIDAPVQKLPRHELWEAKGNYAFSISPHGAGLDCHRTWEDLVLGCIVIVKTSPLDALYEGLPVVIVKDWSEINEDNFDKWLIKFGDAFTNPDYRERLTYDYWMNIMRSRQRQYLNRF